MNFIHDEQHDQWLAIVPALPGCTSGGKTLDEARSMVAEAIRLYLQVVQERDGQVRLAHVEKVEMTVPAELVLVNTVSRRKAS